MRERLIKNYKVAAATLRDAAHLGIQLADAVRNHLTEELSELTRSGHIDQSPHNETLYADTHGKIRRAAQMPKRLTLRGRIVNERNRINYHVERYAAIFEAAKIIRQRKSADRQKRASERQQRRSKNSQARRDRVSRMARNFASRYDRS